MNKEPIRIAQIMGKWVGGGVESFVMNYYRHIDRSKIQFDFICDEDSSDIPYSEIKSLGGRVIICPPYQKIFKYIKFLKSLFKDNDYKIVHSHINTLSVFPLYSARKAGVPIRIAHSHSTSSKKEWKRNIIKKLLRHFSKKYSNVYFACSEEAAKFQFGNKAYDNNEVEIINNAIDVESFKYNDKIRKQIRKSLNISNDCIVIGHVGRFVSVKNHIFLIDLFKEIYKKNNNYRLLLIGQGPMFKNIKNEVERLKLSNCIFFLGQKSNIQDYYSAMDIFLLPSLYEGLGLVLVEAQSSGLHCISSSNVPKMVNCGNLVKFIQLENKEKWEKEILNADFSRINCINEIKKSGFDIKNEAKKLERKYKQYIDEKGESL